MSTVTIMDASYENCHEAIERIFNLFPLDLEGKKVVIKPNVLRSGAPEDGVTTHPAVLKAVVNEVVKRHPASLIVGDNQSINCRAIIPVLGISES